VCPPLPRPQRPMRTPADESSATPGDVFPPAVPAERLRGGTEFGGWKAMPVNSPAEDAERVWVSWSTGKDAAYALHEIRKDPKFRVCGLLTTVTEGFERVSMHGVRAELLKRQAEALDLPIHRVSIPYPCPNETYETRMEEALSRARRAGIQGVVFGDLFLEDIRQYREAHLAATGVRALFPLWGRPTGELAREMIGAGVRARLICVDPKRLDRSFAGREFDRALLEELPPDVDPCGERGEFHTFVYDGPMFGVGLSVRGGEVVERDGFLFADLQWAGTSSAPPSTHPE
jgi:uncharacterized protein (TIGR00290 family)